MDDAARGHVTGEDEAAGDAAGGDTHRGSGDYATVADAAPAAWLCAELTEFDGTVASVVPPGFAAYARILHPAGRDDATVSWREIAAANGRTAHPLMQWAHIVGREEADEQPGLWDEEPEEGSLPRDLARTLTGTLAGHTGTPDTCWFGLWTGWGDAAYAPGRTAEFEIPHREMFLLSGPLAAAHRTSLHEPLPDDLENDPSVAFSFHVEADDAELRVPEPELLPGAAGATPSWRSPNLWWPEDRAWCVATEIDFTYTYVAGTRACVDALLRTPGLEAYEVSPDDGVTFHSDHVNPHPRPRSRRRRGG